MKAFKMCLALTVLAAGSVNCLTGELIVKSGDKLAFLGDDTTQLGATSAGGYARLVVSGLEVNGVKVEPVYAGVAGNKSNDILARVEKDVLSKKPNAMILSCGLTDVWLGEKGVALDKYKENIKALVDKAQTAGVKPVILTSTMINEDPDNRQNQTLATYNDFLKSFANERKLPLADLNSQMQAVIKKAKETNAPKPSKEYYITLDGIHMAPQGDQMMAEGVLLALGLDDAQIAKAKAAWLEIPSAAKVQILKMVTLKEYNKLAADAAKENLSVKEYLNKSLETLLAK